MNWDEIPAEPIADGILRQIVTGERMMVCRLQIAAAVVTPVHAHPHEQITLVERGRVRFLVNGVERVASPGDVLHFAPGTEHGATTLNEPVVLIDIFSPIRGDFLKA
jgi:quercetin dioxygenase-like cupin family protein